MIEAWNSPSDRIPAIGIHERLNLEVNSIYQNLCPANSTPARQVLWGWAPPCASTKRPSLLLEAACECQAGSTRSKWLCTLSAGTVALSRYSAGHLVPTVCCHLFLQKLVIEDQSKEFESL